MLAILMIVLLIVLTVGWILLTSTGLKDDDKRTVMWVTLLSVGTTSLVLLLVGTVLYLWLTIKAINLTRRQSNFIDSVTHELKSPIASLKLYLQTLTRRSVTDDERGNFYDFMLDDVERLDHLINHILQAARLDRETTSADVATDVIDLSQLLAEIGEQVCVRYEVPAATIRLDTPPCWIAGNRLDLDLIFRNLLDNAVKYGGDPPDVEVVLKHLPAGRARVTIRDNGSGVPKKLRRKIFARFVRIGSELQRKKPGTGLGLYIVQTLVERWKGRVQVHDAEGNSGSIFEVELAATQSSPPTSGEAANQGTASVSGTLKSTV